MQPPSGADVHIYAGKSGGWPVRPPRPVRTAVRSGRAKRAGGACANSAYVGGLHHRCHRPVEGPPSRTQIPGWPTAAAPRHRERPPTAARDRAPRCLTELCPQQETLAPQTVPARIRPTRGSNLRPLGRSPPAAAAAPRVLVPDPCSAGTACAARGHGDPRGGAGGRTRGDRLLPRLRHPRPPTSASTS